MTSAISPAVNPSSGADASQAASAPTALPRATQEPRVPAILAALGRAAFTWDIPSDSLTWTEGAVSIFQDIDPPSLATGTGYGALIEPSGSGPEVSRIRWHDPAAVGPG